MPVYSDPVDPCKKPTPPTVGTPCTGGAKYAGTFGGYRYMITASGCDYGVHACSGNADTETAEYALNISSFLGTSLTDGRANTVKIVSSGSGGGAAHRCFYADAHGYSDWFAPAKEEAKALITSSSVGSALNLKTMPYWTSTEADASYAYNYRGDATSGTSPRSMSTVYYRCFRKY